jgi:hypothetical protein
MVSFTLVITVSEPFLGAELIEMRKEEVSEEEAGVENNSVKENCCCLCEKRGETEAESDCRERSK